MIISFKSYEWINPKTGRKPITGDEFLYYFVSHPTKENKKL